jgi:hypothetical protein
MDVEPKTQEMSIYVTPAMRDAFDAAAARLGTRPAEYVRQATVERMIRDGVWPPASTRATAA